MNKLLHNNAQTARALELYGKAKGFALTIERVNRDNKLHTQYTANSLIGMQSLPILLLSNRAYITTTHSIIDYIEATRRGNKIFCSDPSPNPEQVATVHLIIRAIQNHLYLESLSKPAVAHDVVTEWHRIFDEFFSAIHNDGQAFLDENGFSILDCFFYPVTSMHLSMLPSSDTKDSIQTYRERVLSRTEFSDNPDRNPDIWNDNDEL
jgi:glutathione S-transferase